MKKNEIGITLIALVVTIVVLLILAGISITALVGENGLITRAKLAAEKTNQSVQNDIVAIEKLNQQLENLINGEVGENTTGDDEPELPVDITAPTVTINLSRTITSVDSAIEATVMHTDNESKVAISNCKYIYNTTSEILGIESINWGTANDFVSNPQTLNLIAETAGTYYLHVLTVDEAGNKSEQISEAIIVQHTGGSN